MVGGRVVSGTGARAKFEVLEIPTRRRRMCADDEKESNLISIRESRIVVYMLGRCATIAFSSESVMLEKEIPYKFQGRMVEKSLMLFRRVDGGDEHTKRVLDAVRRERFSWFGTCGCKAMQDKILVVWI